MAKIWISWEKHRRNYGTSSELGFTLYEIISTHRGIKRYLECSIKTITLIHKLKPTHVVVQNPSILLAYISTLLQKIYKFRLVVDAHNAGIYPAEGQSFLLNMVSKIIQRLASCVIVTNQFLKDVVEANGGQACILPDTIPVPPENLYLNEKLANSICFICTYAVDEPYLEVVEAARLIPPDIDILITGKYDKKLDPSTLPENVKLLGFLSEIDYWTTLRSCRLVMDLTLRENCLVCGAYEATSLNKAMILSNTSVTREYFNRGCVYTDPDARSIASAINYALENSSLLESEVVRFKGDLEGSRHLYLSKVQEQVMG